VKHCAPYETLLSQEPATSIGLGCLGLLASLKNPNKKGVAETCHAFKGRMSVVDAVQCMQMMEQRELEIKSLRSEIEKLKRREQTWSLELQDAAAVTSTLTERMELLEMALADKEESLQKTEVCCHLSI
jgi:predicted  nucleic acid-binding Zn-ribbon protein